jgi:hypothetical protein
MNKVEFKIAFSDIVKDAKELKFESKNGQIDSYIRSYPEFLKYFTSKTELFEHDVIIGSHFVYGWMPTILKNIGKIDTILPLLNHAKTKNGELLGVAKLDMIRLCINNSLVGTSKLLHFINPEQYAIWDSVVFKYLTGRDANNEEIKDASAYLEYLKLCGEFSEYDIFKSIKKELEGKIHYEVSNLRAVEMIMYETQRLRNKAKSEEIKKEKKEAKERFEIQFSL